MEVGDSTVSAESDRLPRPKYTLLGGIGYAALSTWTRTNRRRSMSLLLPGNIPVAARSLTDIENNADIAHIVGYDPADALASKTKAPYDEIVIWARPTLRRYKAVWEAAAWMGLVDDVDITDMGDVDIDHVFPRSWAKLPCYDVAYVRLFPVFLEVNRSAGGGRERLDPRAPGFKPIKMQSGIYFATDLLLRKMLNLPVGTSKDHSEMFRRRR
jgi:hypothetical protein